MLNVVMLSVVMLSVVMLSVVMLNVVMLSVTAPNFEGCHAFVQSSKSLKRVSIKKFLFYVFYRWLTLGHGTDQETIP
jgi:hypothetical protein